MTMQKITLTSPEEKHAPPAQEIDVSVIDDKVFITVYDGSDENVPSNRKLVYNVPILSLRELFAALGAFGANPKE